MISSCNSEHIPLTSKNVYELVREKSFSGKFNHLGFEGEEFIVYPKVSIKFTISEEDDCVYYIYTYLGAEKDSKTSVKAFNEVKSWLRPHYFALILLDEHGNEIFKFSPFMGENCSNWADANKINTPFTRKGKLHFKTESNFRFDETLRISPKFFRSKIERMASFEIYVKLDGGGMVSYDW
jgi:hypothetical protein